jgi:hypothetical protein
VPLDVVEHVDRSDGHVGIGADLLQQPDQPGGQRGHGVLVEQRDLVLQHATDPGRGAAGVVQLGERGDQVVGGRPGGDQLLADVQARQDELRRRVAPQHQHDLEQRMPGQRRHRVDRLDHPLERHRLVRLRRQVGFPDPAEQLTKRRVPCGVRAQYQGVGEVSDQVLQRVHGTAADR